jgi:hypothetical protein
MYYCLTLGWIRTKNNGVDRDKSFVKLHHRSSKLVLEVLIGGSILKRDAVNYTCDPPEHKTSIKAFKMN